MLLERLESGLLLFETPQGLVPVELSRWQRAYLLWTFRNFRRLSLPLLSSRQATMIHSAAQKSANRLPRSYDPALVIGVVEGFRFPPVSVEAAPVERVTVAKPAFADGAGPTIGQTSAEEEVLSTTPTTPRFRLPKFEIAQSAIAKIKMSRLRFTGLRRLSSGISWPRFVWPRFADSGKAVSRLATIMGVLLLCAGMVLVWHRLGAVTRSEAHARPAGLETTPPTSAGDPQPHTPMTGNNPSQSAALERTASLRDAGNDLRPSPEAAVRIVKPASSVAMLDTASSRTTQPHHSPPAPKLSPSNDVQATRPPLRSVYPDFSGIDARGVVVLAAEVDSEGAVRSVRVIRGKNALAAPAIRAVRQWRYPRYFEDGKAISTETNIVISVFSDDAVSMSFPPSLPATR